MSKKPSFSKDQLKEIFESSLSKQDVAFKLGYTYTNGKVYKKIEELSLDHNLSMDHFDPALSQKLNTKYSKIEKDCPICGKVFETQQGHPKEKTTCSSKCSNTYFAASKHTELSNLKRSLKLTKNYNKGKIRSVLTDKNVFREKLSLTDKNVFREKLSLTKQCIYCSEVFETTDKDKKFCNNSCSTKYKWSLPEFRANIIEKANERVANGTHSGWASRDKLKPSYPEQYVIKLLTELNVSYTREYKVGKWFIDFADIDRKLALEIDGKQHELPERKASDEVKDQHLKNEGWTILRIKWKKITKEFREELIKNINILFNINN